MSPAPLEQADKNDEKAWQYWPFGDIFGGSLAPLLVDTLGSPISPLPKDPRALIANPHAAQVPPVHCALVPVRGQGNGSDKDAASGNLSDATGLSSDWLLINLGVGPWVLGLSASPTKGSNCFSFGIPGMIAEDHEFKCELRKHENGGGNVWLLEDIPTTKTQCRQLAAIAIRSNQQRRGFCRCSRAPPPEEVFLTLVIPNVRPDGCCAQFFRPKPGETGLWEKYCSKAHKHLNIFEGTIFFHSADSNQDGGAGGRHISVEFDGTNIFHACRQPLGGPWRFHFSAPLSAAQALATAFVAARQMPLHGSPWGSSCRLPRPIKAGEGDEGCVSWPHYWSRCSEEPQLYESPPATRFLQNLIMDTFRQKRTRDRRDKAMPVALHVVAVLRMENPTQWKRYQYRKLVLRRDRQDKAVTPISPALETMTKADNEVLSGLDEDLNEAYLFHGTTPKAAIAIQASGFNLRLAGHHRGKMFGRGVYFAEESSKADEYAEADDAFGLCCMLFCRVICGEPLLTVNPCPEMDRQLDRRRYDSAIGDRRQKVGTYRELVVYDGAQAYAEYAVLYRRAFTSDTLPPQLVSCSGNGVADHLLVDRMECGELDHRLAICGEWAEYLKHVSGVVSDSDDAATNREHQVEAPDLSTIDAAAKQDPVTPRDEPAGPVTPRL